MTTQFKRHSRSSVARMALLNSMLMSMNAINAICGEGIVAPVGLHADISRWMVANASRLRGCRPNSVNGVFAFEGHVKYCYYTCYEFRLHNAFGTLWYGIGAIPKLPVATVISRWLYWYC